MSHELNAPAPIAAAALAGDIDRADDRPTLNNESDTIKTHPTDVDEKHRESAEHVEDANKRQEEEDAAVGAFGTRKRRPVAQDEAAQFLAKMGGGRREITAEENKRVLRKIDWNLMPILCVIYWLQFFDKQTLSFASVFGIQKDANLHGKEYSWLGSIVYLAWYLALPISSYILVRYRMSIIIPVLVTAWGAILACMAAGHNFPGLLVARFFLGAVESIIAPAFVLVGQSWYQRSEQPWRVCLWYSQNAWVAIFGSFVAYGLGQIHSDKLHPYQLIFLITGVFTFVFGIACFWLVPDSPVRNKFLTDEEKLIAVERLRGNNQGVENKTFQWSQVWEMLTDSKSWGWFALLFLISVPSGGISTFGPLILQSFGFKSNITLLLNAPFGAAQLIALYTSFWLSTKYRVKSIILLAYMAITLVGVGLLYGLGRGVEYRNALLAGYYITSFYVVVTPLILSWQAVNTAGHSKKTATTAFVAMGQSAGNVVGPLLFQSNQAPYYHSGLQAILAIICIFCGLVVLVTLNLWRLNKRNARRRVAAGKPEHIVDYSMLSKEEAVTARAKELQDEKMGLGIATGQNAFEDLTDQQNDEFIYVY